MSLQDVIRERDLMAHEYRLQDQILNGLAETKDGIESLIRDFCRGQVESRALTQALSQLDALTVTLREAGVK